MIAPHQTASPARARMSSSNDDDDLFDAPHTSTQGRASAARAATTSADTGTRNGTADLAAFLLATGPVEDWSPQEFLYSPETTPRKKKSERVLSKLLKKSTQSFRTKDDPSHIKRRARSSTTDSANNSLSTEQHKALLPAIPQHGLRTHKPNAKSLTMTRPAMPLKPNSVLKADAVEAELPQGPIQDDEKAHSEKNRVESAMSESSAQRAPVAAAQGAPSKADVLYVHDGNVFEHVSIENMPKRVSSRTISELTSSASKAASRREAFVPASFPVMPDRGHEQAEEKQSVKETDQQKSPSEETDEKTLGSRASPLKKLSHSGDQKESTVVEGSAEDCAAVVTATPKEASMIAKPALLVRPNRTARSNVSTNAATISTQKDAESELAMDPPPDVKLFVERVEPLRRAMAKTSSLPNLRNTDLGVTYDEDENIEHQDDDTLGLALNMDDSGSSQDYATAMRQLEMARALIMQAPARKGKKMPVKADAPGTTLAEDTLEAVKRAEERANIAESAAQAERTRCRQMALRSLHFLRKHKCQVQAALAKNDLAPLTRNEANSEKTTSDAASANAGLRHTESSNSNDDVTSGDMRRLDRLICDLSDYLEQSRRLPPTPKSAAFDTGSISKKNSHAAPEGGAKFKPNGKAKKEVRRAASLRFVAPDSEEHDQSPKHAHRRSASNSNILPSEPRQTEASLYARQIKASL